VDKFSELSTYIRFMDSAVYGLQLSFGNTCIK